MIKVHYGNEIIKKRLMKWDTAKYHNGNEHNLMGIGKVFHNGNLQPYNGNHLFIHYVILFHQPINENT